jgi:hypothetical protein
MILASFNKLRAMKLESDSEDVSRMTFANFVQNAAYARSNRFKKST